MWWVSRISSSRTSRTDDWNKNRSRLAGEAASACSFASFAGLIHQLARQVGVLLGPGLCLFFQVGAGAVAAFDDFVVVEGLVELLHLGGELARVDGADPIVFGGGEDERLGVVHVGLELVVGRDGGEELALFGDR